MERIKPDVDYELSTLDAYQRRVYRMVLLIIPILCISAGVSFTANKLMGYYPTVSWFPLLIFDLSNWIYLAIGVYFIKTGFDENGILRPAKLRSAKLAIMAIIVIQWNFIAYLIPTKNFWACMALFTIISAFFFDWKMVLRTALLIMISTFIAWGIRGDELLPVRDELFLPELTVRIMAMVTTLSCVVLLSYLGGKFLVEELERHVNYDTLTHLLNRRSLDDCLKKAIRRAEEGRGTFCLLLLDIDDFKQVNDAYGHECGDAVLRSVSRTIACGVRKNDYVFRWGGEEILVILYANSMQATHTADRMRYDIAADPVKYRNGIRVIVTVTVGVAEYQEGDSIESLIERADRHLYYGKRNGKNRVVAELPTPM